MAPGGSAELTTGRRQEAAEHRGNGDYAGPLLDSGSPSGSRSVWP